MIFHSCKSLVFQTLHNPLILQKPHESGVRLFLHFYSSSSKLPPSIVNEILNLLKKHDFSHTNASKVVSSLCRLKDVQNYDSVLTFFKDVGFSTAQLEKTLIKMPTLLTYNLDGNIKPKIKVFQDLGFSASDTADIVSAVPMLFTRSVSNRIGPAIMVLKEVLGSLSEVARMLKVSRGLFFKFDLDKTMLPNIEYLKSCGVSTEQIVKFACYYPRFILHKPEYLKKIVEKAEGMGCSRNSGMLIYSARTIASMNDESWEQKLKLFRDLGFSEEQILHTFQKTPQVFAVSCDKIRKVVRLILDDGKYDISDIIRSPLVLICSVEKTVKPRLHVLNILASKNLVKKRPPFHVTHSITKQLFFDRYIGPYLDLILQKPHDSVRLFLHYYSSSDKLPADCTYGIINLLEKHDFSPRYASKVASSSSRLKDAQKCDSLIHFLKDAGFSPAQLETTLIKMPNFESNIKLKMKIFQDLGFSTSDIAAILSADPWILNRSGSNRIVPSIMALNKVLGSISEVAKLLKVSGVFLKFDLEQTMLPNIDYLKSCGISPEQILKFIYSFPRFLLHKPENMKKFVEKAEKMGCSRDSKMFIYGVRTFASMNEKSWEQTLQLFRDVGFSEEQIMILFPKNPEVFCVSCNKIRKAVNLILEDGNYDVSDIIHNPRVFMCSVEKTLKSRLHVLDILVRKKLLKKLPPFYVTFRITKQMFFDRYIVPYLCEVDEFRRLDDWRKEISKLDSIVCS